MSLCISSICTVPPNHQESRDRKSHGVNIDNLGSTFTDMVPQAFAFIKEKPTPHPNETKGRCSSSDEKQDFTASFQKNFRAMLYEEGISQGASELPRVSLQTEITLASR